jgi:hypothetical protein
MLNIALNKGLMTLLRWFVEGIAFCAEGVSVTSALGNFGCGWTVMSADMEWYWLRKESFES